MWQFNTSNELYHYGVLGMKWGTRRSLAIQNRANKKQYRKEFRSDLKGLRKHESALAKTINDVAIKGRTDKREEIGAQQMLELGSYRRGLVAKKGEAYVQKLDKRIQNVSRAEGLSVLGGALAITAGLTYVQAKYDWL